jgi:protein phosphatase
MQQHQPHVLTANERPGAGYDIVGDVHGCFDELTELMGQAGWIIEPYEAETADPIGARHPDGRLLVFAGDLTDRGPASHLVLRLALGMMAEGTALWVIGNHDWKLARYLRGNPVKIAGGLASTIEQISPLGKAFCEQVRDTLLSLPHQIRLPMPVDHPRAGDGFLTVVHGAAPSHHLDQVEKGSFERSIYGYADGAPREDGTVSRIDWALDYAGDRWIVYGHEPHAEVDIKNRVIALDTGCVFGNKLSLYQADSCDIRSVPARANYSGKERRLC